MTKQTYDNWQIEIVLNQFPLYLLRFDKIYCMYILYMCIYIYIYIYIILQHCCYICYITVIIIIYAKFFRLTQIFSLSLSNKKEINFCVSSCNLTYFSFAAFVFMCHFFQQYQSSYIPVRFLPFFIYFFSLQIYNLIFGDLFQANTLCQNFASFYYCLQCS